MFSKKNRLSTIVLILSILIGALIVSWSWEESVFKGPLQNLENAPYEVDTRTPVEKGSVEP